MADNLTETTIGVTDFKAKCLALIDDIASGRTGRVVLVRRNRPVAALVPVGADMANVQELWGALKGTVVVEPGTDLTQPSGAEWDADA